MLSLQRKSVMGLLNPGRQFLQDGISVIGKVWIFLIVLRLEPFNFSSGMDYILKDQSQKTTARISSKRNFILQNTIRPLMVCFWKISIFLKSQN